MQNLGVVGRHPGQQYEQSVIMAEMADDNSPYSLLAHDLLPWNN